MEAGDCIFFFLWGEKGFILRLNYIRLGYNKVDTTSFAWRNQPHFPSTRLHSSRLTIHKVFYMKNISWNTGLFT